MRIVRQVLDDADFEHLVRGGTLQIDVRNTRAACVEICLADVGVQQMKNIVGQESHHDSMLGEVLKLE
jgi:hypothetical protein